MHSEAPGRYAVYDYTDAPQLGGHILPRNVTITEGGRVVSKISVESLQGMPSADPALFIPTAAMKAKGPAVAMTSATKVSRVQGSPYTSAVTLRPVCVFGIVTPAGHLVEAHALQPSDPNSRAAVEDARKIDFSPQTTGRNAAQAAFRIRDREVCPRRSIERDVSRSLEVPVVLVLELLPGTACHRNTAPEN